MIIFKVTLILKEHKKYIYIGISFSIIVNINLVFLLALWEELNFT